MSFLSGPNNLLTAKANQIESKTKLKEMQYAAAQREKRELAAAKAMEDWSKAQVEAIRQAMEDDFSFDRHQRSRGSVMR